MKKIFTKIFALTAVLISCNQIYSQCTIAVNAGTDQTVCAGASVTLSSSFTGATSLQGNVCATANENGTATLSAPTGAVFTSVVFASYGLPTGTCGNFSTGSCHSTSSQSVVEGLILGQNTVSVQATNGIFGDPCGGIVKKLYIEAQWTSNNSTSATISWDNGITDATSFTPNATTTYSVTATDANNCTATDQVVVTVDSLPTVDAGADQTVCAGTNVTLTGSGATSYAWDNGVTNGIAFAANVTTSYTTTYTVTGTGANNCTATDAVDVTVDALPTVDAGADQTVCAGTNITLTGDGATSYAWDNGVTDGAAFAANSTTTYTVTGTNGNTNCSNTDQVAVTVDALPTVDAGADQTVCAGDKRYINWFWSNFLCLGQWCN